MSADKKGDKPDPYRQEWAKIAKKGGNQMEIVMGRDKETKGAVRYSDQENHNLYLRKEEAAKLGNPKHILIKVEVMVEA